MDLIDQFIETLERLPDIEIQSSQRELVVDRHQIDYVVKGKVKDRPIRFLVETKSSGYPRDIRNALRQMLETRNVDQPVADAPIIIAPVVSEASRELLRQNRVSYWDSSGSLYLDLPWALYWIERPSPPGIQRSLRNIYRGSTAQVLHALLLQPDRTWHITELAALAGVSTSTVHQVCTFLQDQLWMEKVGKGPRAVRILREPGALLDAWAAEHTLAIYVPNRFHRWAQRPDYLIKEVSQAFDSSGIEYGLTLSSGAQFVAPYTTDIGQLWMLTSERANLDAVIRSANLRPVEEGESVTLFTTRERWPLMFRQQVDDVWVVSDVQLYLDLFAWPQRGKEQARHLRIERLRY